MDNLALIGKKIGMSREFFKTGQSVPVTVLKMEIGRVINVINKENRGYSAVQIGFGKIKNSKLTKAMKGYFAKKNTEPKKTLKEFRLVSTENFKEGNEIGLEIFENVKFVDVKYLTSTNLTFSNISNPISFPSLKFSVLTNLNSLSVFFGSVFFLAK